MTEPLATWWLQQTPGVNYWRAQIPARHLPGQALELGYADLQADANGVPWMPRQKGAAVWLLEGTATRGVLMAHLQDQGVRVLLEADDNYTTMYRTPDGTTGNEWRQTPDPHVDYPSIDAHRQIASFVDGIIVSTPYLESEYRKVSDRPVFVCPNSVDPADWPPPSTIRDGVLRVGFAGSISHWADIHLIRRALLWASRQDGVEVCYFGQKPQGFDFVHRHVPWTDSVAEYRENVSVLDVGLAPLVETRWSKGKSDVKSLEYAMAGALTICSNTEPFKAFKGPCVRVGSAKGFERAVKWAVTHRDEVRDMARLARAYVLEERSIQANIWRWRAAINQEGD